jgi:nitrous oxidase accessory protein NosD
VAALTAAVWLLAACSPANVATGDLAAAIAAAEPGATLQLAPGTHPGPIVIDKPLHLTGGDDVMIATGPGEPAITIIDTAGVSITDVTIEGGEPGVFVRRASGVTLSGLTIRGTAQHGIFAHDVEMHVVDCHISALNGVRPQGIEIINSDARLTSSVEGCVIEGPMYEGIVSHVSRVSFLDNQVTGTERRGISITEMSVGEMTGNDVRDGSGAGLFCGDMSLCTIINNAVSAISPVADGPNSALGHGIVVHYQSAAYIQNLTTAELSGDSFRLMLGSALVGQQFDPDDRTHSIGSRQR